MDAAVNSLGVYLKIKGLFISAREDPDLKDAKFGEFYYTLLSYLEKQTNLPQMHFWNGLEKTRIKKLAACKYFNLLGDPHGFIRLDCTADDAAVFVIMSGRTAVTTTYSDGTSVDAAFSIGQTFGALNIFDDPFYRRREFMDCFRPLEMTITCFLPEGTSVLQLTLSDYKNYVVNNDAPRSGKDSQKSGKDSQENAAVPRFVDPKLKSRANSSAGKAADQVRRHTRDILVTPEKDLTRNEPADTKATEKGPLDKERPGLETPVIANKAAICFAGSNHLLPQTPCDATDASIMTADVGTKLTFSSEKPPSVVYLVLEGTFRLQLERVKIPSPCVSVRFPTCSPLRSPSRDLSNSPVRMQLLDQSKRLPICDFEPGSLLYFTDECFTVEPPEVNSNSNCIQNSTSGSVTSALFNPPATPRSYDTLTRKDSFSKLRKKNLVIEMAKDVLIDPNGLRMKWMNGLVLASMTLDNEFTGGGNRRVSTSRPSSAAYLRATSSNSLQMRLSRSSDSIYGQLGEPAVMNPKNSRPTSPLKSPISKQNPVLFYIQDDTVTPLVKLVKKKKLYEIIILFEKPTTYITIPVAAMKAALTELSLQQDTEDMSKQLHRVSNRIIEKVTGLLPWIDGQSPSTIPLTTSAVKDKYSSFVYPVQAVGPRSPSPWIPEQKGLKTTGHGG